MSGRFNDTNNISHESSSKQWQVSQVYVEGRSFTYLRSLFTSAPPSSIQQKGYFVVFVPNCWELMSGFSQCFVLIEKQTS